MTGASGFVGSNLVRELLKGGEGVRCLLREPKRPAHLAPVAGVEIVKGDVTARASILKALEDGDIDCVIHLVGILFEHGNQTFRKIHVEATENCCGGVSGAWGQTVYTFERPRDTGGGAERVPQDEVGCGGDSQGIRSHLYHLQTVGDLRKRR